MKLRYILFTLLLVSCGSNQITLLNDVLDPPYYPEQYACREYTVFFQRQNYSALGGPEAIYQAAAAWNAVLGEERFHVLDSPEPADNPFRDATRARSTILVWIEDDQEPQGFFRFWKNYGPCACGISMRPESATSVLLLQHELGHCLGLSHTDEEGSVMEAFVDFDAHITQESIDLVREHTNTEDPPELK